MKLFAVHLSSVSSDNYYETVMANKMPTWDRVKSALKKGGRYGDELESMNVEEIWEVSTENAIQIGKPTKRTRS